MDLADWSFCGAEVREKHQLEIARIHDSGAGWDGEGFDSAAGLGIFELPSGDVLIRERRVVDFDPVVEIAVRADGRLDVRPATLIEDRIRETLAHYPIVVVQVSIVDKPIE